MGSDMARGTQPTAEIDAENGDARGHVAVMPGESVRGLGIGATDVVVDCTAGGGGHLRLFAAEAARVIGLDRDLRAFADDAAGGIARSLSNVTLVHAPFSDIEKALRDLSLDHVDVVFADLGVSSFQLNEGERGFSFQKDAPLDMRMDTSAGETAAELVARLPVDELANILFRYGDESRSRKIARYIKDRAPTTTLGLASAVLSAVAGQRGKVHPATRTFQALRIAVNNELQELEQLLAALPRVLRVGGRAGFLTFHSLEDRLVKLAFRETAFRPLTKKPLTPSDDEVRGNPRSRSAKLRVAVFDPDWRARAKAAFKRDDEAEDGDDEEEADAAGADA